jgi:hypothetical protein
MSVGRPFVGRPFVLARLRAALSAGLLLVEPERL